MKARITVWSTNDPPLASVGAVAVAKWKWAPARPKPLTNMSIDDDVRFRLMRLIEVNPDISQRELSRKLGISLGGVNYCVNALVEKGLVKIQRFRKSDRKMAYAYALTPRGLGEKARLTQGFLARKMAEYEALKEEIESIQRELRHLE